MNGFECWELGIENIEWDNAMHGIPSVSKFILYLFWNNKVCSWNFSIQFYIIDNLIHYNIVVKASIPILSALCL